VLLSYRPCNKKVLVNGEQLGVHMEENTPIQNVFPFGSTTVGFVDPNLLVGPPQVTVKGGPVGIKPNCWVNVPIS
jgi:hypothetical protein